MTHTIYSHPRHSYDDYDDIAFLAPFIRFQSVYKAYKCSCLSVFLDQGYLKTGGDGGDCDGDASETGGTRGLEYQMQPFCDLVAMEGLCSLHSKSRHQGLNCVRD